MKKIMACMLAALGLTTACGQKSYENANVEGFSELIKNSETVLLDVRTAAEYAEGHIQGAMLLDQGQSNFMERACSTLPKNKTIAVYCRSGRRSANAAMKLAAEGYKCVNLAGGITAWKEASLPVATDTYETDLFLTKSGKLVRIHALVHASIRMEYDGKQIMIDPVGKLGERTIDYAGMPKADYILVTHEHFDHFDKDAIRTLHGNSTRLITNKRCAEMYAKGRDNGYILTIDGLRIYVAGDTEDIPEMAAIKDIDIAFLPCNQPFTMTPEQLVKAARMVKPKVLFPYHYGQTDVSTLPSLLQEENIEVRIRHYE